MLQLLLLSADVAMGVHLSEWLLPSQQGTLKKFLLSSSAEILLIITD